MTNLIDQITSQVAALQAVRFASLTYLTKSTKELSRYTVNLGFSYHNLVVKSVAELKEIVEYHQLQNDWTALQFEAANEVTESLNKTLAAHAEGKQNEDYTKKDTYVPLVNGLSLNTVDNTIQLFGLLNTKTVLVEGVYKKVNSAPLTIEKNKVRRMLSVSDFREFALDLSQV